MSDLKYIVADLCDTMAHTRKFLRSVGNAYGAADGHQVRADQVVRKIDKALRVAYKECGYAAERAKGEKP